VSHFGGEFTSGSRISASRSDLLKHPIDGRRDNQISQLRINCYESRRLSCLRYNAASGSTDFRSWKVDFK